MNYDLQTVRSVLFRGTPDEAKLEAEKFWSQVKVGDTSECWLWSGRSSGGYGYTFLTRRFWHGLANLYNTVSTHRFAFMLTRPELSAKKYVLHACGVGMCVNPFHLYLGSAERNAQDAEIHGVKNDKSLVQDRFYRYRAAQGQMLRQRDYLYLRKNLSYQQLDFEIERLERRFYDLVMYSGEYDDSNLLKLRETAEQLVWARERLASYEHVDFEKLVEESIVS
jgi:hypothetical protein